MSIEILPAPVDYYFDQQSHVDRGALLSVTEATLEWTNQSYNQDRASYVKDTYSALMKTDKGTPLAHLRKPGDSTTDLLLLMGSFGTPIFPRHNSTEMESYVEDRGASASPAGVEPNDANKLFFGRLLYDNIQRAGVRDKKGRCVPVIVLSAPSLDHTSGLSAKERALVAKGDFTPFAVGALGIVRQMGYNRIYAAGYSLGTIAGKVVESAGDHDVEVLAGCYVGDAPNFKNRFKWPIPLGITVAYTLDSQIMNYKGDWRTADGPEPRADIARNGEHYEAFVNWLGNGNWKANLAILKGLSVDGLTSTLEYMSSNDIPTSISWSESWLMKGFEAYLESSKPVQALASRGLLKTFRARNAPHISGENQVFLTDVMTRSILFANKANSS